MLLPALLSLFATLAAAVMAYGTDPRWVGCGRWGLGLIMLCRRMQWPLIAVALILCLALLAVVISGKRGVWWLIGLLPVLAMFGHRFVTGPGNRYVVLDEPVTVGVSRTKDLSTADYVVGVVLNGQPYAYPYSALCANPVIVQSDRQKRVLLMWSPFANAATALAVSREVKGRDLEVVCDPADSLLIYDSRTGQFLVALTGRTPDGANLKGALGTLPVVKQTWTAWQAAHPDTKVLSMSGKGPRAPLSPREPVAGMNAASARRLVAIVQTDPPVAIPMERIGPAPLNVTLGGVPIVLFRDAATNRMRAFDRHVEADLVPRFSLARGGKHKNAFMVDSDSGSGWSLRGVAVDGDKALKGKKLGSVEVREDVYWGPASYWVHGLALVTPDATAATNTPDLAAVPVTARISPPPSRPAVRHGRIRH